MRERNFYHANQGIVLRAIFFMLNAAFACWSIFFNIYLKEKLGFHTAEIGVLSSILPFGTILVLPVWGMLADKYQRKAMFLLALLFSMILINGILLIDDYYSFLFYLFLFGSFYSPLNPMLDTIALDYVEQNKNVTYGEIRLWASVGWAFSTIVMGFLLKGIDIQYIFPISSAIFLVTGIIMYLLYRPLVIKKSLANIKFQHLGALIIKSPQLLIFIIIILIYGILSSPVHLFINLYYNEINAGSQHLGIAFAVQALCELPFFFYGQKIIERFGAKKVMVFAMSATMLRMLLYGINSNPLIAIVIGMLHGITIALFLVSVIQQMHSFIPKEWRATGQSFIYIFYFGVGIALGYMISGRLAEAITVQKTMLVMGLCTLVLIVITVAIFAFFKNRITQEID
jgi:PPP family 3-phenylpropionic acid transporter